MQASKFRIFPCGHPRNHVIAFTTRGITRRGVGKWRVWFKNEDQCSNGVASCMIEVGLRSFRIRWWKNWVFERVAYSICWSWEKNLKFDTFELSGRSWVLDSLRCCATIVVIIWSCFGQQFYWAETSVCLSLIISLIHKLVKVTN